MNAEKIIERLRNVSRELRLGDDLGRAAIEDAVAFIRNQTRPLTLEECRDVLNERKYMFYVNEPFRPWEVDGNYLCVGSSGIHLLSHFEARAIARAFLVEGGDA